jgi:ribonucleotide reductase alpha subunit
LDELIDYQKYPVAAAEIATKARRSLGIGFIGLAHYLAKLGLIMILKKHGMQFMDFLNLSNTSY